MAQKLEGTIKPYSNFDPQQDAKVLRTAVKGLGTDEDAIINVVTKRSNDQRLKIAATYKQMYALDLIEDLKDDISGDFSDVIVALMMPLYDYLASEVNKAVKGAGTDEEALIEILIPRTNAEILKIAELYQKRVGRSMESDLIDDTSGDFQRFVVSACNGSRSEEPADQSKAKANAQALFQAGVEQWGTDEEIFNAIFLANSFSQLALTFKEYELLAGHNIITAIEGEMSGDLKAGMLAIVHCVLNTPFYFAQRLYNSMKGLGTDDTTLIRVVVSRSEVDLKNIKEEYKKNYGSDLETDIEDDTSGDYRNTLKALVRGN